MLTSAQKAHHWRTWSRVCQVNDWKMAGGRLSAGAAPADCSVWHRYVWHVATDLATREHRAVTPEDLRHSCYVVSTSAVPGRRSAKQANSMTQLENWSFSRLLHLWALLVEPDDVAAAKHWSDPSLDTRSSYVASIKSSAPDAYVRSISADRFGTRMWENCDVGQLRELAMTIRSRKKAWNASVEQPF